MSKCFVFQFQKSFRQLFPTAAACLSLGSRDDGSGKDGVDEASSGNDGRGNRLVRSLRTFALSRLRRSTMSEEPWAATDPRTFKEVVKMEKRDSDDADVYVRR